MIPTRLWHWRRVVRHPIVLLVVLAWILPGCQGNTVRVSGRLERDGKPYTAKLEGREPETFAVDFVGVVDGARRVYAATLKADGTFTVSGPDKSGIPRGQYRITVLHSGFLGAGGDRFKGRFAAESTPLVVDIDRNCTLVIDVGAGTVSRQ
jgi:hypothetical protein